MNALDRIQQIQTQFGIVRPPAAPKPVATRFDDIIGALRPAASAGTDPLPAQFASYAADIERVASEEGVPPELVAAVAWTESSFRSDAVSHAGARGLMQLMPATAAGLGVNPDDPLQNLRGGARYLRQMLDQFGRADWALAAYNAGPAAVVQYGGIPPYPETQAYVPKVLQRVQTLLGVRS